MINFRVNDLDGLLALKREGVKVDDKAQEYECGRVRMDH